MVIVHVGEEDLSEEGLLGCVEGTELMDEVVEDLFLSGSNGIVGSSQLGSLVIPGHLDGLSESKDISLEDSNDLIDHLSGLEGDTSDGSEGLISDGSNSLLVSSVELGDDSVDIDLLVLSGVGLGPLDWLLCGSGSGEEEGGGEFHCEDLGVEVSLNQNYNALQAIDIMAVNEDLLTVRNKLS